jgi:hypothetical protein
MLEIILIVLLVALITERFRPSRFPPDVVDRVVSIVLIILVVVFIPGVR